MMWNYFFSLASIFIFVLNKKNIFLLNMKLALATPVTSIASHLNNTAVPLNFKYADLQSREVWYLIDIVMKYPFVSIPCIIGAIIVTVAYFKSVGIALQSRRELINANPVQTSWELDRMTSRNISVESRFQTINEMRELPLSQLDLEELTDFFS